MAKKIVVARIQVIEGKQKEFLDVINPLIEATRDEPGNLVYTLYQATGNPSAFILYEEYTDERAFATHSNSEAFKTFAQKVGPILAKELDIKTL